MCRQRQDNQNQGQLSQPNQQQQQQQPKQERQYACTFEGCTKSFNRRDYLERHAANRKFIIKFLHCQLADSFHD